MLHIIVTAANKYCLLISLLHAALHFCTCKTIYWKLIFYDKIYKHKISKYKSKAANMFLKKRIHQ